MVGIAADHRMVFQRTEAARERHVLGPRDVLPAEEQDAVLEQRGLNLGELLGVAGGFPPGGHRKSRRRWRG